MPLDFSKFVAAIFFVEFEICCVEFEIRCSYSWIELTTALPVVALPNVVSVNQNQHCILPVILYDRVLAETDWHGKTAYKILQHRNVFISVLEKTQNYFCAHIFWRPLWHLLYTSSVATSTYGGEQNKKRGWVVGYVQQLLRAYVWSHM